MFKLVGTTLLAALILSGCAATNTARTSTLSSATPSYTPNIVKEESINIGGTTYTYEFTEKQVTSDITFAPIDEYISQLKQRADNNLWPEERLKKEMDILVSETGKGYFKVVGYSLTIGMASNGVMCAMLVQDNAKIEESCMKGIANRPGINGLWWNLTLLPTSKLDHTKPFEVRVINAVSNGITKMVLTPKKSS